MLKFFDSVEQLIEINIGIACKFLMIQMTPLHCLCFFQHYFFLWMKFFFIQMMDKNSIKKMWKHQLMFEIFCQMPWIQNNVSDFFYYYRILIYLFLWILSKECIQIQYLFIRQTYSQTLCLKGKHSIIFFSKKYLSSG